MQTTHPVTGVTEYGGVISMTETTADSTKGYDAQLLISSPEHDSDNMHAYIRRLKSTSTPQWSIWKKILTEDDVEAKTTSLTFGSTSTITTINGNDIKVTMPTNPVATGTQKYLAIYNSTSQIGPAINAHFNTSNLSGTTKGYEELVLGDKSNRFGRLALYSHSDVSGGSYIVANNPTSWINHVLPDTAGWIVTAGNGSSTGAGTASKPVYIDTDGVAKQVTSIDGSAISGIMPAPLYYSRGNSSGIFYIKTNISITSSSTAWPAFQIFVTHSYTQGDSTLITGSCYWSKTAFTASALNYYDPLKAVTSITAIQGDDNIFYLAIKPKATYQRYSIFINTGNMGTQNAISVSTTAPTVLVSVDLVNKAP